MIDKKDIKKMWVWNDDKIHRIKAYVLYKTDEGYMCVSEEDELNFEVNGDTWEPVLWDNCEEIKERWQPFKDETEFLASIPTPYKRLLWFKNKTDSKQLLLTGFYESPADEYGAHGLYLNGSFYSFNTLFANWLMYINKDWQPIGIKL